MEPRRFYHIYPYIFFARAKFDQTTKNHISVKFYRRKKIKKVLESEKIEFFEKKFLKNFGDKKIFFFSKKFFFQFFQKQRMLTSEPNRLKKVLHLAIYRVEKRKSGVFVSVCDFFCLKKSDF